MNKNRPPDKINEFGTIYWYDKDGKKHNEYGYPAEIWANGSQFWFKHGNRHNENGPAEIYCNCNKPGVVCEFDWRWYINDQYYTEEEFKQYKIKKFITNDKE